MLGIADLAAAVRSERAPRASGDLALHVLTVLEAILVSGERRASVDIEDAAERPAPLAAAEAATVLHAG